MRFMQVCAGLCVVAAVAASALGITYQGTLSTMGGGLSATGSYAANVAGEPLRISYTVDNTSVPGLWHYRYDVAAPQAAGHDASLWILKLQMDCGIATPSGPTYPEELGLSGIAQGPYNNVMEADSSVSPGLPGKDYMMTFAYSHMEDIGIAEHAGTIWFSSMRSPAWGDFYAESFHSAGTAWNEGYGRSSASLPGPESSPNLIGHVLVPGAYELPREPTAIPEPLTLLSLSAGLTILARRVARRRKGVADPSPGR